MGIYGIEPAKLSAHVDDLTPDIHYIVGVQGWNTYGGGFLGLGPGVTVGEGTPPAPTNFQVTSLDATTVQIDWCGSPKAAGYYFWSRNINTQSAPVKTNGSSTSQTTSNWAYLFPGVWNYEFCVSAYNGELESGLSNCVVSYDAFGHVKVLVH